MGHSFNLETFASLGYPDELSELRRLAIGRSALVQGYLNGLAERIFPLDDTTLTPTVNSKFFVRPRENFEPALDMLELEGFRAGYFGRTLAELLGRK